MTPIVFFNTLVGVLFTLCFLYQGVFFLVGLVRGQIKIPPARRLHRYAFFIAAHNEEPVIANLVKSIKDQDYPSELIDIFVVADACTTGPRRRLARRGPSSTSETTCPARAELGDGLQVRPESSASISDTYEERFSSSMRDNLLSKNYVTGQQNDAFDQATSP